ncbi:hypothetical protein C0J52_13211, partial [Blattella germanica]
FLFIYLFCFRSEVSYAEWSVRSQTLSLWQAKKEMGRDLRDFQYELSAYEEEEEEEEEEIKMPKRKTEEEAKKRMERCVRLQTMDSELHGWRMEEATYKSMAAKAYYEKLTMEVEELRRAHDFQQEQRRRLQQFEEENNMLELEI